MSNKINTTLMPLPMKGAPGSPYSRKMMSVLRFRRIPFRLIVAQMGDHGAFPKPKVELLPTFYLANAAGVTEAVTDSTPLIRRFEKEFSGRSVLPPPPALRFLDELIEDYADEWLTKPMFHYRWHYAADIDKAGSILPMWRDVTASPERAQKMKQDFSQRQISRLGVVGSSPATAELIESSYLRFLDIFNMHLHAHPYLFGERPSAADFALFGQLTQLAQFDPTPAALTLARSPRVHAWVSLTDDLSGLEVDDNDWLAPGDLPATISTLLTEIARTYVPVMLANARALRAGTPQVETTIDGRPWIQQTFPYQGKCLQWLRESFAALPSGDARLVRQWLSEAGALALIDERIA